MIEKEVLAEQEFVRQEFEKFGLHPDILMVPIEPADAEIHQAVELARNSDLTILFCYDAHLYPSNKKLLEAIQAAARELVVDLLRDPYDAAFLKAGRGRPDRFRLAGLPDQGGHCKNLRRGPGLEGRSSRAMGSPVEPSCAHISKIVSVL